MRQEGRINNPHVHPLLSSRPQYIGSISNAPLYHSSKSQPVNQSVSQQFKSVNTHEPRSVAVYQSTSHPIDPFHHGTRIHFSVLGITSRCSNKSTHVSPPVVYSRSNRKKNNNNTITSLQFHEPSRISYTTRWAASSSCW